MKISIEAIHNPPHVMVRRKYRPPSGKGLRRKLLRRTPKSVAGRHYQLLSGNAAIGLYLKDKIHKAVDGKCWWFVCHLVFAIPLHIGPKGHGSGRPFSAFKPCPVHNYIYMQVNPGLPNLLPPKPPDKRKKEQTPKTKEKYILFGPPLTFWALRPPIALLLFC